LPAVWLQKFYPIVRATLDKTL